ncbi:hypothetical protein D3C81_2054310 [compost metagenome]
MTRRVAQIQLRILDGFDLQMRRQLAKDDLCVRVSCPKGANVGHQSAAKHGIAGKANPNRAHFPA